MNLKNGLLVLTIGMLTFTGCSVNDNDFAEEVNTVAANENEYSKYNYIYKEQVYSLDEIKKDYPNLLDKAYILFEGENIANVFDDEKEALKYDKLFLEALESNSQLTSKNDNNNSTWGFKVRFYEHNDFKGRWWQYRKHKISVTRFEVKGNIPSWLNDRTSSIVLDELDYSKHNSGDNFIGLTCYQDYNQRGRSVYQRATHWFLGKLSKKEWKNLDKGDWNDKISSWSVNGGS
ncbi:hypothetical protein A8C32_10085 [Flavivirga aquatica]|uniref:Uncharacterized protein n=1 Tax=Flavivirga aquatica TaxID=1849968 RepID=A0A1E5TEQ7_9FLAO|nr:hypothetical protein [Flavivirga aquatica]OEK09851.1 hypothetical protein A8C32_10085 [Flavivirga aquatica]